MVAPDASRQSGDRDAMHAEIASRREEIAVVCRSHHVLRLEIFGSVARATDFDPAKSDADFLVRFDWSR